MKMQELRDKMYWYCRTSLSYATWRIVSMVDVPLNPRPIVYLCDPNNSRAPWQTVTPEDITEVWPSEISENLKAIARDVQI